MKRLRWLSYHVPHFGPLTRHEYFTGRFGVLTEESVHWATVPPVDPRKRIVVTRWILPEPPDESGTLVQTPSAARATVFDWPWAFHRLWPVLRYVVLPTSTRATLSWPNMYVPRAVPVLVTPN